MSSGETIVTHKLSSDAAGALPKAGDEAARNTRERKRLWARRARHGAYLVLAVASVGGTALALRPRPVPVDVAEVGRGRLVVAIEESGMTRVKDRYLVSAPATGSVSRLALEPGDSVKEGDPLAEIAPAQSPLLDERTRAEGEARLGASLSAQEQARAMAARATAAMELADQELSRARALTDSGAIAHQALERAEFEARMRRQELASAVFAGKVAAEEVRLARAALGRGGGSHAARDRHLDVVSPIAGSVLRVHQKSAGVVPAGAPLVEVGDSAALEIVVDVLTNDAVHVRPGTSVVIQGWGGERPLAGQVRRVEPSAFTRPSALGVDEQRVNVIIALSEPRDRWAALGDGYRVEARLVLWEGDDVVKAPLGAVFRHGDGWAAFVLEGGKARLVPVQIGHRGETEVEVVSGLAPGATVAVHPGDRVRDGARIEAR